MITKQRWMRGLYVISTLLAAALAGCSDDDLTENPTQATGTLEFFANGEDFIRQPFVSKDGWEIAFTGFTWPGCGCEACTARYAEFRQQGPLKFNPAVYEALLEVTRQGKFRTSVISIFYESSETDYKIMQKAADGEYAVYDLMPNAEDRFGIWDNTLDMVDPDYYISEDGKSGIIVKHLEEGAPYCMWYMHWQGLNPESGVGWAAFKTVVERVNRHLADRVVWMRPSDMVQGYHEAGGWDFIENL